MPWEEFTKIFPIPAREGEDWEVKTNSLLYENEIDELRNSQKLLTGRTKLVLLLTALLILPVPMFWNHA